MADRCGWPRCSCKGTGIFCTQRQEALTQKKGRKTIPRTSKKTAATKPAKTKRTQTDAEFYLVIWIERVHQCQNCGAPIYHFSLLWFHHILPKREQGGYPQYRYCKWNIWILCWLCHDTHDNGNPDSKTLINLRTEYHRLLNLHDNGTLATALQADIV